MSCARTTLDERGRGLAQQLVAGVVAEAVVDRLEAVEVEREHREGLAVPRVARDLVAEALVERAPVGERR